MLSNPCKSGGAEVVMKLGKSDTKVATRESTKEGKDNDQGEGKLVDCSVADRGDGTYELKWRSSTAGIFPIDVLLDGSHGAPA